jgi:hypothetical protein
MQGHRQIAEEVTDISSHPVMFPSCFHVPSCAKPSTGSCEEHSPDVVIIFAGLDRFG